MVRNLYRIYLYAVCIVLLNAATTVTAFSLGLLLSETPLRGPYGFPPPTARSSRRWWRSSWCGWSHCCSAASTTG